jgi:hypothetical protein
VTGGSDQCDSYRITKLRPGNDVSEKLSKDNKKAKAILDVNTLKGKMQYALAKSKEVKITNALTILLRRFVPAPGNYLNIFMAS